MLDLALLKKGEHRIFQSWPAPVTHRLRAHPLYCVCVELEKGLDGDATTGYLQPQSGSQVVAGASSRPPPAALRRSPRSAVEGSLSVALPA
jgi:hypothetical protein